MALRKGKDLQIQGSKRVSTSDLTGNEEVVFSNGGGTFTNARGPDRNGVEGNLSGLVDSDGIKVESFQRQTGEMNDFVHDGRLPFSKTVLHGSELGQLTLPVRMDTKGLHITVLVEI